MLNSLIKTIREDNTGDNLKSKVAALSAMGNIALLTETHPALMAPDIDLFRVMIRVHTIYLFIYLLKLNLKKKKGNNLR